MTGLANTNPALPCGATATAPRRPGLRFSVNVRSGVEKNLTKPRNVAPLFRGRIGLISARIRRAFSAQPAQDPAGDGPAADNFQPSDCWPMEVVSGQYLFHGADIAITRCALSVGKSGGFTA